MGGVVGNLGKAVKESFAEDGIVDESGLVSSAAGLPEALKQPPALYSARLVSGEENVQSVTFGAASSFGPMFSFVDSFEISRGSGG